MVFLFYVQENRDKGTQYITRALVRDQNNDKDWRNRHKKICFGAYCSNVLWETLFCSSKQAQNVLLHLLLITAHTQSEWWAQSIKCILHQYTALFKGSFHKRNIRFLCLFFMREDRKIFPTLDHSISGTRQKTALYYAWLILNWHLKVLVAFLSCQKYW